MADPGPTPSSDRKTSLVVFGVVEIIMGILCLVLIPFMIASVAFASRSAGAPRFAVLAAGIATYSVLGSLFVALGTGSILCTRWARALWICVSGAWLYCGTIGFGFVFYLFSTTDSAMGNPANVSPAVLHAIRIATLGVLGVIYVVIPAVLFLYYRTASVKATCEARDPAPRWTDRCPLPVLAIVLVVALGALMALGVAVTTGVVPFFGTVMAGLPGRLLLVLAAAAMLYVARGLYRLETAAWWVGLALFALMGISCVVSVIWGDLGELYARMGMEPRVTVLASQMAQRPLFKVFCIVNWIPYLAWHLYVRRFFGGAEAHPEPAQSPSQTLL